jgi:hypothetical protein
MNISAWSIRSPMPASVMFLVLMILGLVSFQNLPITRFPNIDIPIVQVLVTQSGAAPSELETQVTKKIENAIAGVNGIWHIISSMSDGSSITTVQFNIGVNTDRALNDVKDAVAKIRADLPRTINEPIVQRIDIEGLPIMTYAASAPDRSVEDVSWFVDDVVARELQSIKGVGGVTRSGGVDREIRVALDPRKLLSLNVTAGSVNRQLRATNVDLSGGRGEIAGQEQAIRTLAGMKSVDDLARAADLALLIPQGPSRRARHRDGRAAEARTFARLDGKPVVAFGIVRAKGASDATVAALVEQRIARIQAANPGFELAKVDSQVDFTIGNYKAAMKTLVEGAVLSIIVVFLFLRDIRATLVSAVALPLSAIPTFWVMSQLGFSLNVVSLLAITLVTGILVDDAIVEIENIVRHMRMGKSPYRASLEAADEIGLAVIAISLTIVAVFAPVSFMGGIAGQYFRQFGLTVAIAVLFSLLVARLITPLMAAYLLRPHDAPPEREGWIMRSYTGLVRWSVRHRWITLAAGVVVFVASIASTKLLRPGFIPGRGYRAPRSSLSSCRPARASPTPTRITAAITGPSSNDGPGGALRARLCGQILGGAAEIRKATLVINLSHKERAQHLAKGPASRTGQRVASEPEIRFWFLKGTGHAICSSIIAGSEHRGHQRDREPARERDASRAILANPILDGRPRPAGAPDHAANRLAADLGVSTEALLGDDPGRDPRRHRRQPRQVQRGRPAHPDPGRLQALRARADRPPEATQGPDGFGPACRSRPFADFEIGRGPTAINRYDRTRRVTIEADLVGNHALGERTRGHLRAADRQEPAARVTIKDRGHGGDGGGLRVLRDRDGARLDDGLRRPHPPVRELHRSRSPSCSRSPSRSAARSSRSS